MINKETIISVYDEKLTLLQWLKSVNKALDEAVLTNVEIEQRGNATFVFVFTFEDGTQVESNEIIVNQGESVNGASIRNGHLYLTLTNGDELDAGNVKPVSSFSIDASQHLIVHYGDGTTQDLGAIFTGNVSIAGTLNATKVTGNEIIETMTGYSARVITASYNNDIQNIYASAVKNGNKLTLVFFFNFTMRQGYGSGEAYAVNIPASIGTKLYPFAVGSADNVLDSKKIGAIDPSNRYATYDVILDLVKANDTLLYVQLLNLSNLTADITYLLRYEVTFLLSDNLVQ